MILLKRHNPLPHISLKERSALCSHACSTYYWFNLWGINVWDFVECNNIYVMYTHEWEWVQQNFALSCFFLMLVLLLVPFLMHKYHGRKNEIQQYTVIWTCWLLLSVFFFAYFIALFFLRLAHIFWRLHLCVLFFVLYFTKSNVFSTQITCLYRVIIFLRFTLNFINNAGWYDNTEQRSKSREYWQKKLLIITEKLFHVTH